MEKENSYTPESKKRNPVEVTTARGSTYKYLPDGRTQRYKKAIQELNEPQDILVFIPPWDLINEDALKIYPEIFQGIENQPQYEQLLLKYAQIDGHTMRVVDLNGNELRSNKEISEKDRVLLAFIDRADPKNTFTLPISITPKIGYITFDTRKFVDQDGETKRQRHIGNEVVDIKYSEN